jgi:hypothetical protein
VGKPSPRPARQQTPDGFLDRSRWECRSLHGERNTSVAPPTSPGPVRYVAQNLRRPFTAVNGCKTSGQWLFSMSSCLCSTLFHRGLREARDRVASLCLHEIPNLSAPSDVCESVTTLHGHVLIGKEHHDARCTLVRLTNWLSCGVLNVSSWKSIFKSSSRGASIWATRSSKYSQDPLNQN